MSSPSPQPNLRRKRWTARRKTLLSLLALAVLWGGYEIIWRVTGEPVPVVDYFAKLNDLVASYQPDSDENAWETIREVLVTLDEIEADAMDIKIEEDETLFYLDYKQLRVNPHLPDRFPREMFIAQQLEKRGSNGALQRVADMPVIRRSYAGENTVFSMLLPELSRFQHLSRTLAAQMRLESEADDFSDLTARYEQCLALARASASQATIIERLVGDAIAALAYSELSNILMERHLDEPTCRALLGAMDRQLNWPPPEITIEAERISILDMIQACFTDDGHGDGRIDTNKLGTSIGIIGGGIPGGDGVVGSIVSNFMAGRRETTDKANDILDEYIRISRMSFSKRREATDRIDMSIESFTFRHYFLGMFFPAIGLSLDQHDFILTLQRGARLMLHLEIYFARHGRYPESLDELVPDILPEMLLDPLTDGPFFYRRLVGEAGGLPYVLYSAGRDGIDDHADLEITDVEAAFALHGYGPDGGDILLNQPRETRQEYE